MNIVTVVRQNHSVVVRTAPTVSTAASAMTVRAGESALLQCSATAGRPAPALAWHRSAPGPREVWPGAELLLETVTPQQAGLYTCTGDNGWPGHAATATTLLTVLHAPLVQGVLVVAGEGEGEVELVCRVTATPPASLTWARAGTVIPAHQAVTSARGSNHSLLLSAIPAAGLQAEYTCTAENELGRASASTKPAPARFLSNQQGPDTRRYTLEWVVISPSPVTECTVKFRPAGTGDQDWLFITAAVRQVEQDTFQGKVTLGIIITAVLHRF